MPVGHPNADRQERRTLVPILTFNIFTLIHEIWLSHFATFYLQPDMYILRLLIYFLSKIKTWYVKKLYISDTCNLKFVLTWYFKSNTKNLALLKWYCIWVFFWLWDFILTIFWSLISQCRLAQFWFADLFFFFKNYTLNIKLPTGYLQPNNLILKP